MMGKRVAAIVPAAGSGKRFGHGGNKPFQMLRGKPLIIWALEALQSVDGIKELIPVFKKDEMEQGLDLIEVYRITKVSRIASGGKERQDSVYAGLELVDGDKTDAVLIHDSVRPLIEKSIVEETIKQLNGFDGVIVGVPLKDTVKEAEAGIVKKTLKRESLWAVQTPQVFRHASLIEAYKKAMAGKFYSTDDSAIVERYGGKVKVIMGSYTNIKITTPEDLDIAEMFLKEREKFAAKRI